MTEEELLLKTCGIDWSEDQHDVAIVNDAGGIVARARVADDAARFGRLLELLAEHGEGEPTRIEIAIETTRGCSWPRWSQQDSRCFRLIRVLRLGTASVTGKPAGNPTAVMRSCRPIFCALTATSTGRCRPTPS